MTEGRGSRLSIPRAVKQFGAVSFLNDVASEMVYPLLPALITSRLGGGAATLGALDGIADAVAAGTKLAAGRLADRPRLRGPLVIGGYILASLVRPIMALAGAAWQVVALRAVDRVGKGVRSPPRDVIIADVTPIGVRGRAFGFHRAMDHAGAVVGPLLAWILLSAAGMTPADVILWSVVPGIIAVALVTWAMRAVDAARLRASVSGESAVSSTAGDHGEPTAIGNAAPRTSGLLLIFIVGFAFARMPETLFLLRLQDAGLAVALVPAMWALLHVVRSAGSYPGGWLSDRIGARRTMIVGWLVYVAVCLGLASASSVLMACFWFSTFGIVAAFTEAPERAFIAASATRQRGTRFGIYHASVGFASLPGGILLGTLYSRSGGSVALVVSAGLAAMLVVGSVWVPSVEYS